MASSSSSPSDEFKQVRTSRKRKHDMDTTTPIDDEPISSALDMDTATVSAPKSLPPAQFPQINPSQLTDNTDGLRKVPIPSHRYTPLKEQWMKIYSPIVEYLHLQIRFNLK